MLYHDISIVIVRCLLSFYTTNGCGDILHYNKICALVTISYIAILTDSLDIFPINVSYTRYRRRYNQGIRGLNIFYSIAQNLSLVEQ